MPLLTYTNSNVPFHFFKAAQHMRALEIDPGSTLTRDVLRRQYIAMVKKYHPDTATNSDEASMEKFMQVDEVSPTFYTFSNHIQTFSKSALGPKSLHHLGLI